MNKPLRVSLATTMHYDVGKFLYAVTGESGSGKIWFAKQSLRRQTNLEVAAFIYKEIGDEDASKFEGLSGSYRILFFL